MNARLSVLCTLKRAIGSDSGHITLTSTLKRTGKRPSRLQARLSVQLFDSMPKNIFFVAQSAVQNRFCKPLPLDNIGAKDLR